MAEAGIGSPISQDIVTQLNTRRAVIGKQGTKTSDDLMFLSGNTAWVKLSSGVNTLSQEEIQQFKQQTGRTTIVGGNGLAKNNMLLGGLLANEQGLRGGIDTVSTPNPNAAYRNNPKTSGIRPMPGITNVSIESKNTFGTLREASVDFSVWTLEDFEMVEKLYLRPGFTMLLEWGHSLYLNNAGTLQKTVTTVSPITFFSSTATHSKIADEITSIRKQSDNNYDAMIGYVKNFDWKYTPQGEYQCTLKIISKGAVLESLTAKVHPAMRGVKMEEIRGDEEQKKTRKKSPIHNFAGALKRGTEPYAYSTLSMAKLFNPTLFATLQDFPIFFQKVDYKNSANMFFDDTVPTHWVPLSTVVELISKHFSNVDNTVPEKDNPDRYDVKIYYKTFDEAEDVAKTTRRYLTSPQHFSIDPDVCILPKKPAAPFSELGLIESVHDNLSSWTMKGGDDNILNILVNIPYLEKLFDGAMNDKGEFTKSIGDIVQELLDAINTALGGVTDLGLAFEDEFEGGTYFVVDRNNIQTTVESPEFNLAGIDSIFTDISVSSAITNAIASQISVAAQGSCQHYPENVDNILNWNPGVIDRTHKLKDLTENSSEGKEGIEKDEKERVADWMEAVTEFFDAYNSSGWSDEEKEAARTLFTDQMTKYMKQGKINNQEPIPGPIPVELSLKLDGIGGLKIAQTFRIAGGILPSRYQGAFGYIITGLSHTIGSNNRWETSIKTQYYNLAKPAASEAYTGAQEIVQDREIGAGGTGTTYPANTKYTSQSCVDDSKIKLSPNYNLSQLSCAAPVIRASVPASGQLKTHPTYGQLTREDIILNLKNLAVNVLEPIKRKYPNMFVTNAYRNKGGKSQHEAGMAADIQFSDVAGSLAVQNAVYETRAKAIKELLNGNYDQFLLEYKTTRGGRPWIHISYRSEGKRKEASTFLNDTYAANGRNKLYNALA
jgi:zinc D-Ala-D-Ala carboxypeptidase